MIADPDGDLLETIPYPVAPTFYLFNRSSTALFSLNGHLKELNKNGTTLIYTSHQLSEAEALCEKVALIDEGKIIANDKLSQLYIHHSEEELEGLFLKLTGKAYRDSDV